VLVLLGTPKTKMRVRWGDWVLVLVVAKELIKNSPRFAFQFQPPPTPPKKKPICYLL
jgi:hypothetical protein